MVFLEKSILAALMIGATHYIDLGAGNDAAIYYESETAAHMRLPDGRQLSGRWTLREDGYHVEWSAGPTADWRLAYAPGRIGYVDAEGNDRGVVTRIVYGDAEGLSASP